MQLREYFSSTSEPLNIHYRINAGYLPLNHWLHDPLQGGGRIIGEGCHFIDLVTWLAGSLPVEVSAVCLPDEGRYRQDNAEIRLRFSNGSVGTVTYLANGNKNFAKERVEVFAAGRIGILEDYRSLELVSETRRRVIKSPLKQDKGHQAAWQAFIQAIKNGGTPPIPYDQIMAVHRACYAAVESINSGATVRL